MVEIKRPEGKASAESSPGGNVFREEQATGWRVENTGVAGKDRGQHGCGCVSPAERLGTQEPDPAGREAGRGEPERGEPGARKAWPDRTVRARRAQQADPDATPGWTLRTRTAGAERKGEGRGTPGTGHGFGNRRLGVLVTEV